MSFSNSGGGEKMTAIGRDCKPDYESQAAILKVKLDSTFKLKDALVDFANQNGIYDFREISSFAEMLGGVELIKLEQELIYRELLAKIEEKD